MVKTKTKKMIGVWLIVLGLLGVFIPHIGFLANLSIFSNLSIVPHAVLEIISGIFILVGYLISRGKI